MIQATNDVKRFMVEMGQNVRLVPDADIPAVEMQLRYDLIAEEVNQELLEAIANRNLPAIADGCADAIYVIIGTALAFGIDLSPIWNEVQRANMDKLTGPVRADGKRLKPEGWRSPDIDGLIEEQGSPDYTTLQEERYFIGSDDAGYNYIVPTSKYREWSAWREISEDNEESWDAPGWAERIEGGFTFTNPVVESLPSRRKQRRNNMDTKLFKKLAENARKIDWDETALLDKREVAVKDVDLNGKVDVGTVIGAVTGKPVSPMSATVTFIDGGQERTVHGTFWPRDFRPESVNLDGAGKANGKVSLAGSFAFTEVDLRLRFRWTDPGSAFVHEFLVEGEVSIGNFL